MFLDETLIMPTVSKMKTIQQVIQTIVQNMPAYKQAQARKELQERMGIFK